MKPLVFASYAQFGVDAEGDRVLGARNGIRQTTQYSWRPNLVVSLNVFLTDGLITN